jgi:metal-responsive CopG/Arc/MetJ family transcriptional regulator
MKALISFPDDLQPLLIAAAKQLKTSRSEIIRLAVSEYLSRFSQLANSSQIESSFGLWKASNAPDGLTYQQKLRAEWE